MLRDVVPSVMCHLQNNIVENPVLLRPLPPTWGRYASTEEASRNLFKNQSASLRIYPVCYGGGMIWYNNNSVYSLYGRLYVQISALPFVAPLSENLDLLCSAAWQLQGPWFEFGLLFRWVSFQVPLVPPTSKHLANISQSQCTPLPWLLCCHEFLVPSFIVVG